MTDSSYFNISEIKLSITSLFSVQIMSFLGVSDIIYSDLINPFHTGRVIFHQNLKWQMEAYQTPQKVLVALTLYITSGDFSHLYEE